MDRPVDLLAELDARGLVHDTTDRDLLAARLAEGNIGVYIGFDPTADSLHAGHLVGQLFMRRFQLAGHRPFPLAGGATGMVGDPGGRSEERNLLDNDTLRYNVECIKKQLTKLLDFEPGPYRATLVNNADWTQQITMLEFLRDVGKHFTVNQMMAKESVRSRIESEYGISYTEFSYMLLQANDFRHLYEHHDVELQAGASDQWGNIVAGVELIRRKLGSQAFAMTHPLMTRGDGAKFGKSVGGAVWLDPARTSPYQFRQFWVQCDDQMVATYLKMLSMRPLAEIDDLVAQQIASPERRPAQRALAEEMTTLVHGHDAAVAAQEAADVLFGADPTAASQAALEAVAAEVPTVELPTQLDGVRVHELLVLAGIAKSNGEVSRLLGQGAVRAGNRVLDADGMLSASDLLRGQFLLLRKGKRDFVVGKSSRRG
jgi:tyrosyl-tRNA synthetase